MATFLHTLPVDASPAALWALVCDPQRVAELFPYMTVSDLTTSAPGCARFTRRLTVPALPALTWQEVTETGSEGELHFRAEAGDLSHYQGRWQVAPQGAAATLTLALEYEIPAHLAPNMPAPLVSYMVGELFKSICARLKDAAEGARV